MHITALSLANLCLRLSVAVTETADHGGCEVDDNSKGLSYW